MISIINTLAIRIGTNPGSVVGDSVPFTISKLYWIQTNT